MDNNNRKVGLFGSYDLAIGTEPNATVYSTPASNALSPYLNFDPTILNSSGSKFIVPEGQKETRGRFELMFFTIGGAVIAGSLIGSTTGLYRGLQESRHLPKPIRTTSVFNYISRQGASTSSAFGSIALIYSIFGTSLSYFREVDDQLNTVASGTFTGLFYRSASGLKGSLRGGLLGMGLSALYVLITSRDRLVPSF